MITYGKGKENNVANHMS